jgi:hypothetical protein
MVRIEENRKNASHQHPLLIDVSAYLESGSQPFQQALLVFLIEGGMMRGVRLSTAVGKEAKKLECEGRNDPRWFVETLNSFGREKIIRHTFAH